MHCGKYAGEVNCTQVATSEAPVNPQLPSRQNACQELTTRKSSIYCEKILLQDWFSNVFRMGCMRKVCCLSIKESNWPLTPIFLKSVAIHLPFLSQYFCKSIPFSWQKVVHTQPIVAESSPYCDTQPIRVTICLPFALRYFANQLSNVFRTGCMFSCLSPQMCL